MRHLAIIVLCAGLAMSPGTSSALSMDSGAADLSQQFEAYVESDLQTAQNDGGRTLSEAIEQVRSQTGGRVLSAETRISGNREVHHIKVLTKDGKVRTVRVQGRRLVR